MRRLAPGTPSSHRRPAHVPAPLTPGPRGARDSFAPPLRTDAASRWPRSAPRGEAPGHGLPPAPRARRGEGGAGRPPPGPGGPAPSPLPAHPPRSAHARRPAFIAAAGAALSALRRSRADPTQVRTPGCPGGGRAGPGHRLV